MKKIIIALFIVALGTSTAYAASSIIKTGKQWAEVKASSQTTEIYRISDWDTGVTCYFAYIKGNPNTAPQMSCVLGNSVK